MIKSTAHSVQADPVSPSEHTVDNPERQSRFRSLQVVASSSRVPLTASSSLTSPSEQGSGTVPLQNITVFESSSIPDLVIPVLSLQTWQSAQTEDEKYAFATQMNQAFSEYGFMALTDHGLDLEDLQKCYDSSQIFFNQPESEKMKLNELGLDGQINGQKVYTPFGTEHAKDNTAHDLKEFVQLGNKKGAFPENIPGFKENFERLFSRLDTISEKVLGALSLALNLDEKHLSNLCQEGNSILRILHYPPIGDHDNAESIRAAAHEDINVITLLVTATAKGLQIKAPVNKGLSHNRDDFDIEKVWVNAVVPNNSIIINIGDMLESMTNGHWKATTHRVANPGPTDPDRFNARLSIPYFKHPNPEVSIGPLQEILPLTGGVAKQSYPYVTAEAAVNKRLAEIGLTK